MNRICIVQVNPTADMEVGMTQKITVELEDDLDGGPADETVRFALGGSHYKIDLSKKNATTFRKQLAPYVEHARKAGRGQRRRSAHTPSSRLHSGDIRAWAKNRASRSAPAAASLRALRNSTKSLWEDPDASLAKAPPGPYQRFATQSA
jgi:nucleoid-associated protein Lsr2